VRIVTTAFVVSWLLISGCGGPYRALWHDTKLPSGRVVKVTSFNMVWGIEHDDRDVTKDSFSLEYVMADPKVDAATREAEALDVFELARAVSEQWGFRTATIAGFPALERKGRYDLYQFRRQADGRWTFTRTEAKVFSTD